MGRFTAARPRATHRAEGKRTGDHPVNHFEIVLEARPCLYFWTRHRSRKQGNTPGTYRHSERVGSEHDWAICARYALNIWPLARVVEVWHTNVVGDRLSLVYSITEKRIV